MSKCRICKEKLEYKTIPYLPMPGWFECKNGHRDSYYSVLAREMIQIQPMELPKQNAIFDFKTEYLTWFFNMFGCYPFDKYLGITQLDTLVAIRDYFIENGEKIPNELRIITEDEWNKK